MAVTKHYVTSEAVAVIVDENRYTRDDIQRVRFQLTIHAPHMWKLTPGIRTQQVGDTTQMIELYFEELPHTQ